MFESLAKQEPTTEEKTVTVLVSLAAPATCAIIGGLLWMMIFGSGGRPRRLAGEAEAWNRTKANTSARLTMRLLEFGLPDRREEFAGTRG